ncbi:MAG: hypothetical protein R2772_00015 [Chitinophagales bacterium]
MKKNTFLSQNLPGLIMLNNVHTHPVLNALVLSLRPLAPSTKDRLVALFDDGLGPPAAQAHLSHIVSLGEGGDVEIADASINPRKRVVSHQFSKWRRDNLGERSTLSAFSVLREKLEVYKELGHEVVLQDDPLVVVIVTAIMGRVHSLITSADICFVDSTASCDAENHAITFILAPSMCGGLPLGVVITQDMTATSYESAFRLFKDTVGSKSFYNKGGPAIFMTDDSDAEVAALERVWPESVHKLCIFHVAQAMWRWLWDSKHSIPLPVCFLLNFLSFVII